MPLRRCFPNVRYGAQRQGETSLDFHLALHRASSRRQLIAFLPVLLATPYVQDLCAEHREIIEAVEAGDPDWAAGALRAHLRGVDTWFGAPRPTGKETSFTRSDSTGLNASRSSVLRAPQVL
jgi:DNA-binding FadR family transcriptional regulator